MLEKYYRINQAAGVSIHINNDGSLAVSTCLVTVQDNQLEIGKKAPDLKAIDELKTQLPAKSYIALNLSGKGILHKKIDKIIEVNQNNFNLILPNGNPADFYIQNFISGEHSFVSIIRKADADKWISGLEAMGFIPLMLSLGPFPVQNIISQLNVYDQEITFNGNVIQRDEQSDWKSYRYEEAALSPFALKVELENIHETLVAPYAAAFQLVLASKLDAIHADVSTLEGTFNQKLADNKLKVQGFMTLAVLFVLLLINFVLFSWLGSSNTQLAAQASRTAQSTTDIQGISDTIKQKEGLLHILGWEGGINKSALIDQVAAMLPHELIWREVAVDPIDLNSSRAQKSLVFYTREIRIVGNSEKIIPVNEWIARVKTKSWVKNIQLDSYTYNGELNTGQFTITINY
jgi:hypothetical protein